MLFAYLFVLETKSYYIDLALNSQNSSCLCSLSLVVKGLCHQHLVIKVFILSIPYLQITHISIIFNQTNTCVKQRNSSLGALPFLIFDGHSKGEKASFFPRLHFETSGQSISSFRTHCNGVNHNKFIRFKVYIIVFPSGISL